MDKGYHIKIKVKNQMKRNHNSKKQTKNPNSNLQSTFTDKTLVCLTWYCSKHSYKQLRQCEKVTTQLLAT